MASSYMEILVVLRSKLTEVVSHLVCLLLVQVDALKSGRIRSSVGKETFCQNVADILDQTNLDKPVRVLQRSREVHLQLNLMSNT